jgi:hypothetical protein
MRLGLKLREDGAELWPKRAAWPENKSGLITGLHNERKSTMSNTKIALTTLLFAA